MFLSLAEQLTLTEEEWKQLFVFLIPVLNQVTDRYLSL